MTEDTYFFILRWIWPKLICHCNFWLRIASQASCNQYCGLSSENFFYCYSPSSSRSIIGQKAKDRILLSRCCMKTLPAFPGDPGRECAWRRQGTRGRAWCIGSHSVDISGPFQSLSLEIENYEMFSLILNIHYPLFHSFITIILRLFFTFLRPGERHELLVVERPVYSSVQYISNCGDPVDSIIFVKSI